jgi:hypothetical protein
MDPPSFWMAASFSMVAAACGCDSFAVGPSGGAGGLSLTSDAIAGDSASCDSFAIGAPEHPGNVKHAASREARTRMAAPLKEREDVVA